MKHDDCHNHGFICRWRGAIPHTATALFIITLPQAVTVDGSMLIIFNSIDHTVQKDCTRL